jgi:hypothetical protein
MKENYLKSQVGIVVWLESCIILLYGHLLVEGFTDVDWAGSPLDR